MHILQLHNQYFYKGGEDIVIKNEKKMLEQKGHKVNQLIRKNSIEINTLFNSIKTLINLSYSNQSIEIIEKFLKKNGKPDLVHIHNIFPLWTYSIFKYFYDRKIPMIVTLHNYRFIWSKIEFFDKDFKKYGLFKNSKLLTFFISKLFNKYNKYLNYVDNYICVSKYQKKIFSKKKFIPQKLLLKENPISVKKKFVKWNIRKNRVIYVGRLSHEKGCSTLLDVWRKWGNEAPMLDIIGDGSQRKELESLKEKYQLNKVRFRGNLSHKATQQKISLAKLLIIPSEWHEPFGLVLHEAFAKGTPICSSDIGGQNDFLKNSINGFIFKHKDSKSMLSKLKYFWNKKNKLKNISKYISTNYNDNQTTNYRKLIKIYKSVISKN